MKAGITTKVTKRTKRTKPGIPRPNADPDPAATGITRSRGGTAADHRRPLSDVAGSSRRTLFHVLTSPVRFFEARTRESPSWISAMAPVFAHGLLASATASVSVWKGREALRPALNELGERGGDDVLFALALGFGAISALGFTWFLFVVHAATAVVLDVIAAGSGRARRLVEFTGYATVAPALWAAASLLVLAVWWHPDPLRIPSTAPVGDLPSVIVDYQRRLASNPLQVALRTISPFFALWLVALQAAALRVVSGFSVRAAVVSGVTMASVLVILPWVLLG